MNKLLRLSLLLVFAAFIQTSSAQSNITFALRMHLDTIAPTDLVHLDARGPKTTIKSLALSHGGIFKYGTERYGAVAIPAENVEAFYSEDDIDVSPFIGARLSVLNDTSIYHSKVNEIHDGTTPLIKAYTGKNVLVGIIDGGIDFKHGDFKDSLGRTRVLRIWDHAVDYDTTGHPNPYGYGYTWDSTAINNGTCTHSEIAALNGHGTHVSGIAAGNGLMTGNYKGVAPDANIVVVRPDFSGGAFINSVVDAVDYIYKVADSLGMPAVINASLGSLLGPHDPLDAGTQYIEHLLDEKAGRIMVCAAGNSNNGHPMHAQMNLENDTQFVWTQNEYLNAIGKEGIYFRFWVDTAEIKNLEFSLGADAITPGGKYVHRGSMAWRNLWNELQLSDGDTTIFNLQLKSVDDNFLSILHYAVNLDGPRVMVEWVQGNFTGIGIDSTDYFYRFMVRGTGKLDVYSPYNIENIQFSKLINDIPTVGEFEDISMYAMPDAYQNTVGYWATSEKVITVGSFSNRSYHINFQKDTIWTEIPVLEISNSSSQGPTRLGLMKPDITAPGHGVGSALWQSIAGAAMTNNPNGVLDDSLHVINNGTSMASPHVAGIAALFLEKCPTGTYQDFKDAMIATAMQDDITGYTPGNTWGHGRINAFELLQQSDPNPVLVYDSTTFCESVTISLTETYDSYLWSNGATSSSITLTETDTIFVRVRESSPCEGQAWSDTVIFTKVKPVDFISNVSICPGASLIATAGLVSYLWTDGTTEQSITPDSSAYYALTVTNSAGCKAIDSSMVTLYIPQNLGLPHDTAYCEDMLFELTAPGFLDYNWNTGSIESTLVPPLSGQYILSALDGNGCFTVDTSNVTINSLPSYMAADTIFTCPGIEAEIVGGSDTVNYLWSGGSINDTLLTANEGWHIGTLTSNQGCSTTDSTYLSIHALPAVEISNDTAICIGDTATLSANSSFTSYNWSSGATTQSVPIFAADTTHVTVTDVNGCIQNDSVIVTIFALPVPDLGPDTAICIGDTATLSTSISFESYIWSNGATTQSVQIFSADTAHVIVTDVNGCMQNDSIIVALHTIVSPGLGPDTAICKGDTAILSTSSAFTSYNWSNGATTQSVQIFSAETAHVTVTDVNGCAQIDSIIVAVHPLTVLDLGTDTAICKGDTANLSTSNSFASYIWSSGATTQSVQIFSAETAHVTVTDVNECTQSDSVVVSIFTLPSPDLGPDTSICPGASVQLIGGVYSSYSWSNGAITPNTTVSTADNYILTVTDLNGCSNSDTIAVSVHPETIVSIGDDVVRCTGDTVTFTIDQTGSYAWNTGATTQSISVNHSGQYIATYTDGNGCPFTDTAKVIFNARPYVSLQDDSLICKNGTRLLDAGTHVTYLWQDGSTESTLLITDKGNYSVTVTNANSCNQTDAVSVSGYYNAHKFPQDTVYSCPGSEATLSAGLKAGSTYLWSDGSTDYMIATSELGSYTVTVTNAYGCSNTSSIELIAVNGDVFSIQGQIDGLNEEALVALYDTTGTMGYALLLSDSTIMGAYSFEGLSKRSYLVHWKTAEELAMFGYVNNSQIWKEAATVLARCQDTIINTVATFSTSLSGAIQLSGNVYAVDSEIALDQVPVLLTDTAGMVLASTLSDSGKYTFNGVKPGNYKITVDMPGFEVNPKHTLAMNVKAGDQSGLNFEVDSNAAQIQAVMETTGIEDFISSGIAVYPNPVQVTLHIQSEQPLISVQLMDAAGRVVLLEEGFAATLYQLSVLGLERGTYMLQSLDNQGKIDQRPIILH